MNITKVNQMLGIFSVDVESEIFFQQKNIKLIRVIFQFDEPIAISYPFSAWFGLNF